MPANSQTEYRYNRLTWPDMNEAIAARKLVILPTASTEQHGKHLPLDVDLFLCESVCNEARAAPGTRRPRPAGENDLGPRPPRSEGSAGPSCRALTPAALPATSGAGPRGRVD